MDKLKCWIDAGKLTHIVSNLIDRRCSVSGSCRLGLLEYWISLKRNELFIRGSLWAATFAFFLKENLNTSTCVWLRERDEILKQFLFHLERTQQRKSKEIDGNWSSVLIIRNCYLVTRAKLVPCYFCPFEVAYQLKLPRDMNSPYVPCVNVEARDGGSSTWPHVTRGIDVGEGGAIVQKTHRRLCCVI